MGKGEGGNLRVKYYQTNYYFSFFFLSQVAPWLFIVFIPNRALLVRFGGITGEFGRAMTRIFERRSRTKIPNARPNERPPKRTKKVHRYIGRGYTVPIFSQVVFGDLAMVRLDLLLNYSALSINKMYR